MTKTPKVTQARQRLSDRRGRAAVLQQARATLTGGAEYAQKPLYPSELSDARGTEPLVSALQDESDKSVRWAIIP